MSESPSLPLLIEPHFLPSISWMALVAQYEEVYIDVSAHYQKGSYRNRAHIPGPNGLMRLSVPLVHGRGQKMTMGDVKISYAEDWQKIMWFTIGSCYRRSPFFEFFEDVFEPLFIRKFSYLIDLDMALIAALQKPMGLSTRFTFTQQYIEPGDPGFSDKRAYIHPRSDNPMQLQWRPYTQVFSDRYPFYSDMSCLDVIFNKGKVSLQELIL